VKKKVKSAKITGHPWIQDFVGAITVCDSKGIILEMNNKAIEANLDQGGKKLIGTNLFDCHPEPSRTKLRDIMETQRVNIYTIEKKGQKKLIYQAPWFKKGKFNGFVEIDLDIPFEMPHFIRD
jgi:transcriptional regulator with PAS, ATPase and Fis domain